MATRKKLTERFVESARHTAAGNFTIYKDDEQRGFGLRVTAAGAKTFILDYRDQGGAKRRLALAAVGEVKVEKAREIARRKVAALLAKGEDPIETKRRAREGDTLDDVAARYVADLRLRATAGAGRGRLSSVANVEWLLARHVPATLKSKKAAAVNVEDLARLHRALSAMPATADHVRALLHSIFERARVEQLRTDNPAAAVRPYRKPATPRRALSLPELARLGDALRAAEGDAPGAVAALRLLALTGMRRSELLGHAAKVRRGSREGLRWSDVDLDNGTYTLAAHGGGSGAKGGAPRELPLGRAAVELLRRLKPRGAAPDAPVIASPKFPSAPLVGLDKDRLAIFAAAGIEGADAHCLRHSFESIAFEVAPAFAGALTGRAAVRDPVLNAYIHPEAARLREVADAVADRIARALAGGGGTVVEFRGRA
jgi:integrase